MSHFVPTRTAALERLNDFVPKAGVNYTSKRNYDLAGHPHVSQLSPYIRHRALTETEVVAAVTSRFSSSTAEKFIQEVCWRTYWKGWLELRPRVWDRYQSDLAEACHDLDSNVPLRRSYEQAVAGQTGIECFDHWARELVETGYVHNHARMWFASIWIFTLGLPWTLGADFFFRHLLDGDPASNTLSWRWVAGIQTRGKAYLARPDNIARYTNGSFRPTGLATEALPISDTPHEPAGPVPITVPAHHGLRTGVLMHHEDLSPTSIIRMDHQAAAVLLSTDRGSPLQTSNLVITFRKALTQDATRRYGIDSAPYLEAREIGAWAEREGLEQIVTAYAPVGPVSSDLTLVAHELGRKGIHFARKVRDHDTMCWPHATRGYFKFKENIPKFLRTLQSHSAA